MVTQLVGVDPESRYTIKETCALLDINRNTLRRYTEQQKISFEIRLADGKKLYSGREIERLCYTKI